MLDRLRAVTTALSWAKPLALAGCLAGPLLFLADLADLFPVRQDSLMIPGLLLTTSCLLLLVGLSIFPGIPDRPKGWFSLSSLKIRLVRLAGNLLALVFLLFSLATLYDVARLVSAWLRSA